jgi:hypothetical protein
MPKQLPDLGRYSDADMLFLLKFVLETASSDVITKAIEIIGQDEFNTISAAVDEREFKEDNHES